MIGRFDLTKPKAYKANVAPRVRFIQDKLDGVRIVVRVDDKAAKPVTCYTRSGKTDYWQFLKDIDHIADRILALPASTMLDCELWVPGQTSTDVVTHAKARSNEMVLTPFALPWFDGSDSRMRNLLDVNDIIRSLDFNPPKTTVVSDVRNADPDMLLTVARDRKLEGFVLKNQHYAGWWKLKPDESCDCVITGFEAGKGKHRGRLGALRIGLFTPSGAIKNVGRVGTGFSDAERQDIWNRQHELDGTVCEVTYDCVAAQGGLRFPRFVRLRDDKPVTECTVGQLS